MNANQIEIKTEAKKGIENYFTAPVTVVEGCVCSDDKPWYPCHNFEDVLDGSNLVPSTTPTVDAVAYLITKHPKARFIYTGCKNYWDAKYGMRNMGREIILN
jgi:hypothetical protein